MNTIHQFLSHHDATHEIIDKVSRIQIFPHFSHKVITYCSDRATQYVIYPRSDIMQHENFELVQFLHPETSKIDSMNDQERTLFVNISITNLSTKQ